ncbi:unnamed protein product [Danaus chrysippus]|uniref:(African queen) hypothetical protein n=1 Tax=Danaus chrysippus TaxID=151541 RepID=A0A8J2QH41_9NEOP|nr:unnamed protein product [Danaus chrysippus]
MNKNLFKMILAKVWMCLVMVIGARARSAPPAPVGCQWDYSDTKLSESNFLTCNIKTIGSADFLFKKHNHGAGVQYQQVKTDMHRFTFLRKFFAYEYW